MRGGVELAGYYLSIPNFSQLGTKIKAAAIAIKPAKNPAINPIKRKYQKFFFVTWILYFLIWP